MRFGVDAVFANDAGRAADGRRARDLMDRTPPGNERRSELASLQSEVQHTVADFADGKASAAPISTYVMPALNSWRRRRRRRRKRRGREKE